MTPLRIGLTGPIGSGKSTVAAMLETFGARVVSGDELGRKVLEEDKVVVDQLVARLGEDIRRSDGSLDRRLIGYRVFGNKLLTQWLTELTFPGILRRWSSEVDRCERPVLVFDAALIFEWGIERQFALNVLVVADREIAWKRATAAGRFSENELKARAVAQLSLAIKSSRVDVVVENNDSKELLQKVVTGLWKLRIEPLVGKWSADG